MYIQPYIIKELISYISIKEVVNNYINIVKNGKNYLALCPFHIENNPSFVINDYKQCFHCFGCGIHGNSIDFIMKINNINFLDAIKEIAELYNYTLPIFIKKKNISFIINKKKFHLLMKEINEIFKQNINNNFTLNIFLNKRNISKKSIKIFELGYANNNNLLLKYYKNNLNIFNILLKLGLIKKINNKYYDFFRNRLIFPIYNKLQKIIGFGGRILLNNINKKIPKYLNSINNDFFIKSNILYGIDKFLKQKSSFDKLILVEGYLDVIKLYQNDIKYVVGILGSSISENNIKLLFQISNKIIICFDSDNAGYLASYKLLKIALFFIKNEQQLFFVLFPKNNDPDSFIEKYGKKEFLNLINKAIPFYEFLFQYISDNIYIYDNYKKINILVKLKLLILNIKNEPLKLFLIDYFYKKLGIINKEHFNKLFIKIYNKENNKNKIIKFNDINLLLSIILQNLNLIKKIPKIFFKFMFINKNLIFIIKKIYKLYYTFPLLNLSKIIEYFRFTKYKNIINKLSNWNNMINKNFLMNTYKELFLSLIKKEFKIKIQFLLSKIKINNDYNLKYYKEINKLIKYIKYK